VQVALLFLPMMPRVVTSEWFRLDGWTHTRRPHRHRIVECIASASTCTSPLQNSIVMKLEPKFVIFLYSEYSIYCLYLCTCVFLLRQESFDIILVNNPSFYDGSVTIDIRATSKLRTC
jgi:hypothetical protein